LRSVYYLLLLSILNSCANIKPPTGGEKDEVPPKVIKSIPSHSSRNFKGNKITVFFNEPVESKSLISELIITPNDDIKFREIPKKKSITIKLKDTLRSNTTYNFNFGNGIVDITEKNPSTEARIAFSTGPDIDTAFLSGIVIDMLTQEPVKEGIVVLHPTNDTINPEEDKPSFMSRIGAEGVFKLENLPQDSFSLYSIIDKNKNLLFNSGKEQIGEYTNYVFPNHKDTSYTIYVAAQKTNELRYYSSKHNFNYSEFEFNKGAYTIAIEPDTFLSQLVDGQKKLRVFHRIKSPDSISIKLSFLDSSNYNIDTLVYLKSDTAGDTLRPILEFSILPDVKKFAYIPDTISFISSVPIKSVKLDTMQFVLNNKDTILSTNTEYKLLNNNWLQIVYANKAKSIYLRLISGLIISTYNDSTTTLSANYQPIDETKFGQIEGSIQTKHKNIIIELISLQGKVIDRTKTDNEFIFRFINPGSYKLRAIVDSNNNNKWDPGDHLKDIPPERIYIYAEDILLKANWILQDKLFKF
jgi:hypothetical protein